MRAIALFSIAICWTTAPTAVRGEQPMTLPEVVKRLRADSKTPDKELVKTGVKLIQEGKDSTATRLVDELAFLSTIADRRALGPQQRKYLEEAAETLERKYHDEPNALLRVLLLEADLYRDGLQDRKKERETLEKAESLQEAIVTQQALDQLNLYLKLGESYLGVHDPESKTQKKSLEYYTKVLEFEFPARPSSPRYGEYQTAYIKAASRLVEMTSNTDLKKLRFHPFALAALEKHYPQRAKFLNKESPTVAAFNAKFERWLELTAKELPQDSAIRVHVQAVLDYLRKDKP